MTEKLFNEGIIKLKTGTVIVVVFSMMSALVGAGVAWEKIQARLRHLDGKTDVYNERYTELEKRVSANDVKFAEIQSTLKSIETNLIEIKQKVK
jgi:hypothetical protein